MGGRSAHRPFHSYTMKQAIEEGFILDVLAAYTPVESYYKLVKKVPGDPEYDVKRARKKLRRYVEGHDHAIRLKAEIMACRPFPRAGDRAEQGRGRGARDGRHERDRARDPRSISPPSAPTSSSARAPTGRSWPSGEHDYGQGKVFEVCQRVPGNATLTASGRTSTGL